MRLGDETFELDLIAKALRTISKEISYGGLAEALLEAALDYSGAARGAVLLSEGGELVAKADASFPREKARILVSRPPLDEFRLPAELDERVLTRQETVLSHRRLARTSPSSTRRAPGAAKSALPLPACRSPAADGRRSLPRS